MATRYKAVRRVNMFTTAKGVDIPILEDIEGCTGCTSIPQVADRIAAQHVDCKPEPNTIFIVEER